MRHIFKLLLATIIVFFFTSIAYPQDTIEVFRIDSLKDEVTLGKYWKYHPGDDTAWAAPGFDDSDWDTISPGMDLEKMPEGRFEGFGWFRLHVQIDSSLKNETYALMIDQQGASEIYLNGERVASYGKLGIDGQNERANNPKLIPSLVRFGDTAEYVLAVRYSNMNAYTDFRKFHHENAGFTISLAPYRQAVNQVTIMARIRQIFFIILTVFVFIAFLHLLLYLFYRKQPSNLYFFLFMVVVSMMWLIILHTLTISNADPHVTVKVLFYLRLAIALTFPLLSVFIYSIFYDRFPRIIWFILGTVPIILALVIIRDSWTVKVASLLNILILADIIRNIVRAIMKKKRGAWIIGAGFLLFIFFFLIVAVLGITANQEIITSPGTVMGVIVIGTFLPGIIAIPLSMSIYLAIDFARTNKDLEKQLENVKLLSAKTIEQEKEKQRILENQKERLEIMVAERTEELAQEKDKTEKLLLNTLPSKVVDELKEKGRSEPESFEDVTVYFSDIVGFTSISSTLEPKVLIEELNDIFTVFDDIMDRNNCERIKTIGDAYLAVSGMPEKDVNHAENMISAAIDIKKYLEERNGKDGIRWQARIGIHTGKVVGGIVGVRKYIYDVFGDTINTASRMESNSEPMRINVSETTYSILKGKYPFIEREPVQVKGKGMMKMFFLDV